MSTHATNSTGDSQIAAEAERWLARHDRGLTADETNAFAAWRARAPAHGAEFDRLAAAWHTTELLRADPELVARAAQVEARTRVQPRRRTPFVWATGLAAAAAVALAFLQPWREPAPLDRAFAPTPVATVEVQPGTGRQLVLPDGSVVRIRGDSEVVPAFTAGERRVRLTRGEAHFFVHKDANRPFVVESQGVAVRAIGTAFNVKHAAGALDVLVTEGVVALQRSHAGAPSATAAADDPFRARASERATVPLIGGDPAMNAATLAAVSAADIDRALEWQVARLTFRQASLADAVAAFNSHGGARIELADAALARREVTGTYRSDRADAFVRLLEQASEVRVERTPDGRVRLHAAE